LPLIVVPTPIGNMEDITLRALGALRGADIVACEDTRRTIKLLNRYDIRKPLISFHRHNERRRSEELVARIERGETVALVSDAGTPGVSDPGWVLIDAVAQRHLPLDALPGPNAILPALLLSGIQPQPFLFHGFLEGTSAERRRELDALRGLKQTLVFYVAPHDLGRDLEIFCDAFGENRPAALVREISKAHQEAIRGTLGEIAVIADERRIRGEMVLVVRGSGDEPPALSDGEWRSEAARMKEGGIFDREIANVLFARYGIPRNRVKKFLSRYEGEVSDDRPS
jgi:16S rRNA (cytidine1402-2'-O)-methyltransferase